MDRKKKLRKKIELQRLVGHHRFTKKYIIEIPKEETEKGKENNIWKNNGIKLSNFMKSSNLHIWEVSLLYIEQIQKDLHIYKS